MAKLLEPTEGFPGPSGLLEAEPSEALMGGLRAGSWVCWGHLLAPGAVLLQFHYQEPFSVLEARTRRHLQVPTPPWPRNQLRPVRKAPPAPRKDGGRPQEPGAPKPQIPGEEPGSRAGAAGSGVSASVVCGRRRTTPWPAPARTAPGQDLSTALSPLQPTHAGLEARLPRRKSQSALGVNNQRRLLRTNFPVTFREL